MERKIILRLIKLIYQMLQDIMKRQIMLHYMITIMLINLRQVRNIQHTTHDDSV